MVGTTKIFIVLTGDPRDWPVMSAFTDASVCKDWLTAQDAAEEINLEDVYVLSTMDGAKAPNHHVDGLPTGKEFLE